MAPSPLQQRRTHNTLLFQKLLNLRDGASPFTLILDTLEQGGGDVVREFVRRGKISKTQVIFISFATLRMKVPFEINAFVSARGKGLAALRDEILSKLPPPTAPTNPSVKQNGAKVLLIIDTLHTLCSTHASHLTSFLTSLLTSSPHISLLATLHADIPIPPLLQSGTSCFSYALHTPYLSTPLQTLQYLATTILKVHSLPQVLARKRARDKSLQEPVFGLDEKREGVLKGLVNGNGKGRMEERGVVVSMEMRRRSGRGVLEDFVLTPSSRAPETAPEIGLLDEHPLYAPLAPASGPEEGAGDEGDVGETTFSLGLTEKQRRDREGVVLPYFDAQTGKGGEGGRILYEMGTEDREDFDDEEDEI